MFKKFHSNPFAKKPEAELARRLLYVKSLSREELLKRLEEKLAPLVKEIKEKLQTEFKVKWKLIEKS